MNESQTPLPSPGLLLRLGAWLGITTGFAEAAIRGFERYGLHRFIRVDQHVIWMAPVMNLIWFLLLGVALYGIVRLRPTARVFRLTVGVEFFMAWFGLAMLWTQIDQRAGTILALGLATACTRYVVPRGQRVERRIGRALPWLAGLVVLAVAIAFGIPAWRERQGLANAPRPEGRPPNVLLLVLDTVRSFSLSLYGYQRPTTPELIRWARRGVVFEHAFSAAPWTLPSHATMFTGRWPIELSTGLKSPLDGTYPTIAEALAQRGYRTAGFTANSQFTTYEQGLDRGFMRFEDFMRSPSALLISSVYGRELVKRNGLRNLVHYYDRPGRKLASAVNAEFLAWERERSDRPFFAFLNYFDAHDPYRPPVPFDTAFGADPTRPWGDIQTGDPRKLPPGLLPREHDAYDAAVAYLDHEVGHLLDALEARGVLDSTIVIITSDHGEQFGEHNLMFHANSVYRQLLQVPLIIIYPPRAPAGRRIPGPVSLRDLAQTMLDLSGVAPDSRFPGASLSEYWTADSGSAPAARMIWADNQLIDGRRQFAILDGEWHYVRMPKPKSRTEHVEELYDFVADSLDATDVADSEAAGLPLARFRGQLEAMLLEARQAEEQEAEAGTP